MSIMAEAVHGIYGTRLRSTRRSTRASNGSALLDELECSVIEMNSAEEFSKLKFSRQPGEQVIRISETELDKFRIGDVVVRIGSMDLLELADCSSITVLIESIDVFPVLMEIRLTKTAPVAPRKSAAAATYLPQIPIARFTPSPIFDSKEIDLTASDDENEVQAVSSDGAPSVAKIKKQWTAGQVVRTRFGVGSVISMNSEALVVRLHWGGLHCDRKASWPTVYLGLSELDKVTDCLDEIVLDCGDYRLNRAEFARFQHGMYLNDTIIDMFLSRIVEKFPDEFRSRLHVMTSHFFTKLEQGKFHEIGRWTKNVNVFEKDFVLIPVNENNHWSLAILCFLGRIGSRTKIDHGTNRNSAIDVTDEAPNQLVTRDDNNETAKRMRSSSTCSIQHEKVESHTSTSSDHVEIQSIVEKSSETSSSVIELHTESVDRMEVELPLGKLNESVSLVTQSSSEEDTFSVDDRPASQFVERIFNVPRMVLLSDSSISQEEDCPMVFPRDTRLPISQTGDARLIVVSVSQEEGPRPMIPSRNEESLISQLEERRPIVAPRDEDLSISQEEDYRPIVKVAKVESPKRQISSSSLQDKSPKKQVTVEEPTVSDTQSKPAKRQPRELSSLMEGPSSGRSKRQSQTLTDVIEPVEEITASSGRPTRQVSDDLESGEATKQINAAAKDDTIQSKISQDNIEVDESNKSGRPKRQVKRVKTLATELEEEALNKHLHKLLGEDQEESELDYDVPVILKLDSTKTHESKDVAKNLRIWVQQEWARKMPNEGPIGADAKTLPIVPPNVPLQSNSCDCGVFVLVFAEQFLQDRLKTPFTCTQLHARRRFNKQFGSKWFSLDLIPQKRIEMAKTILDSAEQKPIL